MKNTIIFSLCYFSFLCHINAQLNNCPTTTAQTYLFGNQIKTNVLNGGDMFWDLSDGQFFAPLYNQDDEAPTTIFAAALWVGALDSGGNLKMAAQTYRQSGNDYWAGPLDNNANTNSTQCNNYDRIWRIPGYTIIQLKTDFADNNTIDIAPEQALLEWPAKGNPHFSNIFGFDLPPNTDLAPFFDQNNDNIYDPWDGDHPVIDDAWPNVVAKELLWCVFNDKGNIHTETNGDALGIEVHFTAYAFDCEQDSILDRTVFTRHKIINKSFENLNELYVGYWTDFDLGCWNDDFIGSAPDLNTYYIYNGDNDDTDCTSFNNEVIRGYGPNPPAQSVTLLNQDLTSFMNYYGDAAPQGNPNTAIEYYRYLQSTWRDGTPLEYGGDGFNEGTTPTSWVFPSNPNSTDTDPWSEVSEENTPDDRRGVGGTGPYSLAPNEEFILDMAFAFHWDTSRSNLGNVNFMYENIPRIQAYYNNNFAGANMQCPAAIPCFTDCVWPGDANGNNIVNNLDLLNIGIAQGATGIARPTTSYYWQPYTVNDWTNTFINGLNYKNADCQGDGTVDALDADIVDKNYGLYNSQFTNLIGNNDLGDELTIDVTFPLVFNDTVEAGDIVRFDVLLGNDNITVDNLHGIGLSVTFDNQLIDINTAITYSNSIGSSNELYTLTKTQEGQVDMAVSRFDGAEISSSGNPILSIRFTVANDIVQLLSPADPYIHFDFENILAVQADGTPIPIGGRRKSLFVVLPPVNTSDIEEQPDIQIFPNPTSSSINVDVNGIKPNAMHLVNTLGQVVLESKELTLPIQIDVSHLPNGIYYLFLEKDNYKHVEKVILMEN